MRRLAQAVWYPLSLAAVIVLIAGVAMIVRGEPIGVTQAHLVYGASSFNSALRIVTMVTVLISGVTSIGLAAVLYRKLAHDRMGLFLSFYLIGYGLLLAGPIELLQPVWPAAPWVNSFVLLPVFTGPVTIYLFATFPDGRFVPRWSRWLVLLSAGLIPGAFVYAPLQQSEELLAVPSFVIVVLFVSALVVFAGSIYAQIHRYRMVSTEMQKRQTKWVLYGLGLWLTVMVITGIGWVQALTLPAGSPAPWWLGLTELAWVLSTLFFPISLAIAMLRHQLFDIDFLINRTLTYGVLTGGVAAAYLLAIAAVGLAIQTNRELAAMIITIVAIVALLRPLRDLLQAAANRLVPASNLSAATAAETGAVPAPRSGKLPAREQAARAPFARDQKDSRSRMERSRDDARPLIWLRSLWVVCALVAAGIFVASLPGYVAALTVAPHSGGLPVAPGSAAYGFNILSALLSIGAAGLSLALAWLVFRRRAGDQMALFLSFYMLAHGIIVAGPSEFLDYLVPGIAGFSVTYLSPAIMGPASIAILATFPDGKFVPRWTKPVTYGSVLFIPLSLVFGQPDLSILSSQVVTGLLYLVFFGTAGAMVYAQIYRHRHVSTPLQRQQTKWFVFGFAIWLGMAAVSSIPYMWLESLPPGSPYPEWAPGMAGFWWSATAALPVSLTMAITRSRLYEIDLIINRTLVYGALTASVLAVYALIVGGLGVVFQSSGNLVLSLLATGLVAVLFQPLRQRLQGGVNRLMFGEREDPVSVLSTLGRKLEETVTPDEVLQSIVETVALSLKLPYVAVEFEGPHAIGMGASFGRSTDRCEELAISYQSERIGRLIVSPRAGEEVLSQADQRVLESIARQAGAAVQAAKLAADLQQSRMDLVAAREEERRRLRRDLHDGLGPQLASQSLTLEALERRLKDDPEGAAFLIENLKEQSRSAVRDIRRLVYDLRPPALDELGLVGAIAQLVSGRRHSGLDLKVSSTNEIPPLPAAVEVAAYRIAQEAITNVIRHSGASSCWVEMSNRKRGAGRQLHLEILDNGRGIKPGEWQGVGLHSMRERAEELGGSLEICPADSGGTIVTAALPFPARSP